METAGMMELEKNYIQVKHVSKMFEQNGQSLEVLRNIDFKIRKGEFICIVGGSGCGKSTLLRILTGLDPEHEGQVLVQQKEIRCPGKDRGFVFQESRLFPWLSVLDNVRFALNEGSREEKTQKAEEVIRLVGLDGFEHSLPKELSGGMAQRANIARSLVNHPDILLLDEPFGALDAFTKIQLQEELIHIREKEHTTSKGNHMWSLVSNRPQRIDITGSWFCHFWDTPGCGCKYCPMGAQGGEKKKKGQLLVSDPDEIVEVLREAFKQKGRFTNVMITSGSILSGEQLLDDELNYHIELLQKIGTLFREKRFPSQLIGTAYNRQQLERLYEETGLMSYTTDIEVLNETAFNKLCPGKAKFIGYQEWKQRLKDAAEIFGKGRVNTGIVTGTELAEGIGFRTEDAAFAATSEEAEELAEAGVGVAITVWQPSPVSILKNAKNPSLEYYVRVTKEYERIRRKYGLSVDYDDYRRCGNHPNTDLARLRG